MTREEVKKLLPIMQAYAEGKTIQFLNGGKWYDVYDTDFYQSPDVYRIKPEPKYRPFKNQEECWQEMLKHEPFGWVKSLNGELFCINRVSNEGVMYEHSIYKCYDYLKDNYTFEDGKPFGIKEE